MLDVEQYLDIFLDEAKDHLQNLNQALLEFESAPQNIETVNVIFRIAHTLKGMSATMGFEVIAKLTHKMENLFDAIRSERISPRQEILDILFEGLDILEEQVKSIEESGKEKDINIQDLVQRLQQLEEGAPERLDAQASIAQIPIQPVAQSEQPLSISQDQLDSIRSIAASLTEEGYALYKVEVTLEPDCLLQAVRAYMVFKALEEEGEVVYSDPSSEDLEQGKFDRNFQLLYFTSLSDKRVYEQIMDITEVQEVQVQPLEFDSLTADSSLPAPDAEVLIPPALASLEDQPNPKTPAEEAVKEAKKSKASKTVRVDIDRLDNLMNLVSELIIIKTRLEENQLSAQDKEQDMSEAVEYLQRITTNLHEAVTKVRMVPIERVFNRFPRMIRDLSKDLGKEINLLVSGAETEVDRTVIDEIGDPLIHLLRNSIDHGIEHPKERIEKGKDPKGTVHLCAYQDGNTVVIEVGDDGAGIDIEKVKQKALKKSLISAQQAQEMEPSKAAELIFAPGFSTADVISDVSGRGVGLDVVKTKIEGLGGSVEIETAKDKGSRFIIRLPLTLAIMDSLLVRVAQEKYAIPLNNIKEITTLNAKDMRVVEGRKIILYRGRTLSLLDLKEVLDCPGERQEQEERTVVIVKKGEKDLGVMVDALIGQQEIVIKALGKYLSDVKQIAGATILGNGSVALIIDTNSLF